MLWAAAALLLALGWLVLNVARNYSGNWTGLFCVGARFGAPQALAFEHVFEFPEEGYDGQFYHTVAHDPFLRRGFSRHVDLPRHRYRRILVPGAAWLLALGRDRAIDAAYIAVILAFVGLGAYWMSRIAVHCGHSPAWGLLFLALPSTIIGLDRMVIDLPLAALCAGFACYALTGQSWKVYLVAALAGLTRETGLLLVAGACAAELLRGRARRAALFATAAFPCAAWCVWVHANTPDYPLRFQSFKAFGR